MDFITMIFPIAKKYGKYVLIINYKFLDSSFSLWTPPKFNNNSKNGTLLPNLLWPLVRQKCSSDGEKLLKFQAEGREFGKFLGSLEQFIQTVKGQNNTLVQLVPGRFLISKKFETDSNNSNSNWKKILGFRNMQKKLENDWFQILLFTQIFLVSDYHVFTRFKKTLNLNSPRLAP